MHRISSPTDFVTGLLFLALAALGLLVSSDLPIGSVVRMGAGYVPRLLSLLLAGFGVFILANSLRPGAAGGRIAKALGTIVLGLLLGVVGTDVTSGAPRLTLGIPQLADGLDFVPLVIGLFAIPEIIGISNGRRRAAW